MKVARISPAADTHTHKINILKFITCDTSKKICIDMRYLRANLHCPHAPRTTQLFQSLINDPQTGMFHLRQPTTSMLLPTATTRTHYMPIPQYQLKGVCRKPGMLLHMEESNCMKTGCTRAWIKSECKSAEGRGRHSAWRPWQKGEATIIL